MFASIIECYFRIVCAILITVVVGNEQWNRSPKELSKIEIEEILADSDDYFESQNATLDSILKVRVPESEEHEEVQTFIIKSMKKLGWTIDVDYFCDNTPNGGKIFANIIATYNPDACKRLVFSCHYDSMQSQSNKFVGATDSAVPCMIMITLADRLKDRLENQKMKDDISLQLIFFDGEEAFKKWSDTDSTYGSRHLAEKWSEKPFPDTDEEIMRCKGNYETELDRIEVFILLDLLGAPNPTFCSFFNKTYPLYKRLVNLESKLSEMELLEKNSSVAEYFRDFKLPALIEDDHIPFLKRNVPILHILPVPFPKAWHTDDDNKSNLHEPTINNLIKLFHIFIIQYLHL